jgi:hypothetical protein
LKSNIILSEEVKVTFRFVGDNVNPEVITSTIGLQPSDAHAKGEIVEKQPEQIYPTGFWGLKSSIPPDRTLEEHLENLLDILEPKASLIKKLRDIGLVPNFYCGCFIAGAATSFSLKADIFQRIANIGASLEYHLYSDEGDDY